MQDVKELLYSVIDEIGKQKIRADLNSDFGEASRRYCREIIERCTKKLGADANTETLGTLCESLLHFMLTAALLPSERKVTINNVEFSVVIPSVKSLSKSPDKALVIQVIKDEDPAEKIRQAESVQPHKENIWIVSPGRLQTAYKNYQLQSDELHYSSLVSDIKLFLSEKGVTSLKLMQG